MPSDDSANECLWEVVQYKSSKQELVSIFGTSKNVLKVIEIIRYNMALKEMLT